MSDIYNLFKKPVKSKSKKQNLESELLGELAKLMTKLNYHQEKEEYEECAKIKKEIDKLNKKLDNL